MASFTSALVVCLLIGCSYVAAEEAVEDLQPLIKSTEDTIQGAKTHVSHMLNLSPLPNQDKLPSVVKNESDHLSYEIKKLVNQLKEKIAGDHKPELTEAVNAAVTHLNEAAASLEHEGGDLKQDNDKYYGAVDKVVQEAKNVLAADQCPVFIKVFKGALTELKHDVDNYQYGIHNVIGPHEGGQDAAAGHHDHKGSDHQHHHVHQHHGASSEESSEESSSHHHHH